MEKIIIAAVSQNNVIGSKDKIPWHSLEELNHFKNTTVGYPVIMGRKTYHAIGKPLSGRTNIVITSKEEFNKDVITFPSLEEAFNFCETKGFEKVFIIGGSQIFNEAISKADKIILSRMKFNSKGDKFFPEINSLHWFLTEAVEYWDFTLLTYIKN